MKSLTLIVFLLAAVVAVNAQNKSVYTELSDKKCKTLESNPEEAGWYLGECGGTAGYKLRVSEGDLRQSISVVTPAGTVQDLDFGRVSSAFSSVGPKAEWRIKNKMPVGLIVRFNAAEDPENTTRRTSYLIVSKISNNSSCIVGVVRPTTRNQNAEARKIADESASKPCMEF